MDPTITIRLGEWFNGGAGSAVRKKRRLRDIESAPWDSRLHGVASAPNTSQPVTAFWGAGISEFEIILFRSPGTSTSSQTHEAVLALCKSLSAQVVSAGEDHEAYNLVAAIRDVADEGAFADLANVCIDEADAPLAADVLMIVSAVSWVGHEDWQLSLLRTALDSRSRMIREGALDAAESWIVDNEPAAPKIKELLLGHSEPDDELREHLEGMLQWKIA